MSTVLFLIASLVIVAVPGTGVIYTVSVAFDKGIRGGLVASSGCTLGIIPHLACGTLVSSTVISQSKTAFLVIQFIGACYIAYLGLSMILRSRAATLRSDGQEAGRTSRMPVLLEAVLINLLNPKLTLFFFSFLPMYVQDSQNYLSESMMYGLAFMATTFVVFSLYALLAGMIRNRLGRESKAQRVATCAAGLVLIAFAIIAVVQQFLPL